MPKPPDRPPVGYFWIRCAFAEDRIDYVDGFMGPTLPVPTQGYAGWAEVTRRRRRTALRWDGSPPIVIPVDCVFASRSPRLRKTQSVEPEIRRLEKMAGLTADGDEPPLVQWAANAPHDYNHADQNLWVIDDLQWSTDEKDYLKNDDGDWTMARMTVIMKLWTGTEYFVGSAAQQNRTQKKGGKTATAKPKHGTHTVVAGETLSSIAATELGNANRWRDLAKLNKKRDPDDVIVGEIIKLK